MLHKLVVRYGNQPSGPLVLHGVVCIHTIQSYQFVESAGIQVGWLLCSVTSGWQPRREAEVCWHGCFFFLGSVERDGCFLVPHGAMISVCCCFCCFLELAFGLLSVWRPYYIGRCCCNNLPVCCLCRPLQSSGA
jgi:hypothetical protein